MANPDGPDRRRWHVKKEISVGDLIAFAMAAVAVITAYTTLDKRLAVIEEKVGQQPANDRRQDDDAIRYQARIDAQLTEINRKLDWLMQRGRP